MKFSVITLFPEMISQLCDYGVVGQARKKKLIEIQTINPRDFTTDVHKTVDDRPFGGGDGMVMLIEPLKKALNSISDNKRVLKIYVTPQGKPLTDAKVRELAKHQHLILLSGRYGGVDQRFINDFTDEEISIGDYVLSGGELACGVIIDSVARMLPGVLGHEQSAQLESFADGFLEAPLFTRPQVDEESGAVPEILLSGNHQKINLWRELVAKLITLKKRPELFEKAQVTATEMQELKQFYAQLNEVQKKTLGIDNLEGF